MLYYCHQVIVSALCVHACVYWPGVMSLQICRDMSAGLSSPDGTFIQQKIASNLHAYGRVHV